MKKPHHGYVAYMAMAALVALLQPPSIRVFDPQRDSQPNYYKASRKKRGKRHGKARK